MRMAPALGRSSLARIYGRNSTLGLPRQNTVYPSARIARIARAPRTYEHVAGLAGPSNSELQRELQRDYILPITVV
jgi:hypothetical protein